MSARILFAWLLFAVPAAGAGPALEAHVSHRDKFYQVALAGEVMLAVGYPGLVLRSPDGGKNWRQVKVDSHDALFAVDLLSDGRAIMVGRSGLVLTSSDAGRTWKKRASGCREHLFDVELLPGGQAWAVGAFGTIIHSTDAGASWQPQEYDETPPAGGVISAAEHENEGAAGEARLNTVVFADEQRGWAAGEFGMVLHTTDGGQTWRRQPSASGKLLFDLLLLGEQHLLAAGAEGTLQESRDGGQSWRLLATGTRLNLYGLARQGDDLYLVAQQGRLLVRRQGQREFAERDLDVPTWLNDIAFAAGRGLVAGGRGHLLFSPDGGKSWHKVAGR